MWADRARRIRSEDGVGHLFSFQKQCWTSKRAHQAMSVGPTTTPMKGVVRCILNNSMHAPILARTKSQMIGKGVVCVSSTLGGEHDNIERLVAVSDSSLYAMWRRREKTYVVQNVKRLELSALTEARAAVRVRWSLSTNHHRSRTWSHFAPCCSCWSPV